MKSIRAVLKHQWCKFKQEKGMLIFYVLTILALGIFSAFYMNGGQSGLMMMIAFAAIIIKPILADTIAYERDKKTLESLLSSPITICHLMIGKILFCFLFSTIFFSVCYLICRMTNALIGTPMGNNWRHRSCILIATLSTFLLCSIIGVYKSAKAINLQIANSKIAISNYLLLLLVIIYITVLELQDFTSTIVIGILLYILHGRVYIYYGIKIGSMRHCDFYENLVGKSDRDKKEKNIYHREVSQSAFRAIVRHELKYLATLKSLLGVYAIF